MTFKLRFVTANLILLGMIGTAAYVNTAKQRDSTTPDRQLPDLVTQLVLNNHVRNALHIVGFGAIGYLLGPRRSTSWRQGSPILAYLYAVVGGGLLEGVQLITTVQPFHLRLLLGSGFDILTNMVGAFLGLRILARVMARNAGRSRS